MNDPWTPPADGAWTRADLVQAEASGLPLDLLLFYGHAAPADGSIGPHVLSQWHRHPFEVEGVRYLTAEHFMMAAKATLFDDEVRLREILASATPREAKALGRRVAGFDDATWTAHREDVVTRASVAKFGSDRRLRDYLLDTGDTVLVEASPRDRIWGIGMGRANPDAQLPSRWRGRNLLGFALMQARATLRNP